jgi:hypothetical protein
MQRFEVPWIGTQDLTVDVRGLDKPARAAQAKCVVERRVTHCPPVLGSRIRSAPCAAG